MKIRNRLIRNFKKTLGNTPLGQSTTAEMLPVSFRIKLVNPQEYSLIQEKLSINLVYSQLLIKEGFENRCYHVEYRKFVVQRCCYYYGDCGSAVDCDYYQVVSDFRRKETSIMRFVGASNLFIQLPFMLEGAICALTGAVLSVLTLLAGGYFLVVTVG